jgi:hypothetical protein
MRLRVALLESCVVHAFRCGKFACARDRRRREVDAHRAAGRCGTRRIAGGQSSPASDVQHALVGTNGAGAAERVVVQLQLRVIVHGMGARLLVLALQIHFRTLHGSSLRSLIGLELVRWGEAQYRDRSAGSATEHGVPAQPTRSTAFKPSGR